VACQTGKPSTSHADQFVSHFSPPNSNASCSKTKQKAGVSRQSTLDKFVAKAGLPRARSQHRGAELRDQDGVEGDERVSCINIDAEAAKTWIYPGFFFFLQFFLIFKFIL
jgi:Fanconi anemia group M protein